MHSVRFTHSLYEEQFEEAVVLQIPSEGGSETNQYDQQMSIFWHLQQSKLYYPLI